jgi:ABC-type tungstate transport system permease subunit
MVPSSINKNMTESSTHDQIVEALENYLEENAKFVDKGNKSAGTRARKALMDLKNLATTRRKEIQDIKNADK